MYRIEIDSAADKALRRMPRNTAKLIRSKLLALAADPFAPNNNIKKLTGRDGYRLRIGGWRVIYTLDVARAVVSVVVIKPRGSAYD